MTDPTVIDTRSLEGRIAAATEALLKRQQPDGHWVFELEADATMPAEYMLLVHYLGEAIDPALEQKMAAYLRRTQGGHGGWALVHGGDFDLSASVKAYLTLKLLGEPIDSDTMRRAREAILARGGAARSNVFARTALALYGILSWRSVPVMPVEITLLPRWFPFHLSKISYWARTTIVPLLVISALKPRARNPRGLTIDELFLERPQSVGPPTRAPHQSRGWFAFFAAIDALLRRLEPHFPKRLRARAIAKAVEFVRERLNGLDGLGGIIPAMANSVIMFDALGYSHDHPDFRTARESVEKLLVIGETEAYCQPCLSPVWDTSLVGHALLEAGGEAATAAVGGALDWLKDRQVLDVVGDWSVARSGVRPGGWAFQYENPHYPDLDDTAVVVMAMDRAAKALGNGRFDTAIARAREWVLGMQSRNGGWAAFDADNAYYYLNNIPFADHGALLDPPSEDVTARCISMLMQLGDSEKSPPIRAGIEYLRKTQREDGSWYGRWGVNYIYGTWSVLCALNVAKVDPASPMVRRAVGWLASIQNPDGGWGEDATSYRLDYQGYRPSPSCASQTAWALLGLMAAGEVDGEAVARGVAWLSAAQNLDGLWPEDDYTGAGFPRVFYLRYHGYAKLFPLWALSRYRNLKASNARVPAFGM